MLAQGAADVARHYNVAISEKTQDWANFLMALSAVYGTRFVALMKQNRDARRSPKNNVVGMDGEPLQAGIPVDENGKPISPTNLPLNPTMN